MAAHLHGMVDDATLAAQSDDTSANGTSPSDATVPFEAAPTLKEKAAGPKPPLVAGYDVLRMLGQGGMGTVWEAVDHNLGRTVALKVRSDATPPNDDALWVEAKMAAKIAHPGIVPIHSVGRTVQGEPYYTMDLASGVSLRTMLRDGPIPLQRALSIARAVAEAIGFAHVRGVVHCDIKPGNIIVDEAGHARVLDFGLAFLMTSDDATTTFQPLRGSPPYMSPEQITGEPLTCATDVYSLGVVLYEMLTGDQPFRGATVTEMLADATLRVPEPPSKKASSISAELDRLCLSCLDKRAVNRPRDGRVLERALTNILEGTDDSFASETPSLALQSSVRPTPLPSPVSEGTRTFRFEQFLASSPERLWPFVSNTERFNRAVGLPGVTFRELSTPQGPARKTGEFRVLGMDVAWEEHPFEWIVAREHRVFRKYSRGPLAWLRNRVTLTPRENGGTHLVHEIEVLPNGALGVISAFLEIKMKLGSKLQTAYRRMDEAAQQVSAWTDPFDPPHQPTGSQIAHVSNGITRLKQLRDRKFSPDILRRLEDLLLHAPEKTVERLRPFALADAWGSARPDVLDLLLFSANVGLLDIAWDLVCPGCYVAHEVVPSLRDIALHASCSACGEAYTRDLVSSVELIFRPHREAREIATAVYCTGSPAMRSHVLAQQVLAPGQRHRFTMTMPRADLLVRVERTPFFSEFSSIPAGVTSACEVHIGHDRVDVSPAIVRPGDVAVTLVNHTSEHQVVRIERPPQKVDSVTAATAMTHPTFQAFFSTELLREGEHLRVSHMAFVAIDIKDRAAVLREHGDASAFSKFSWLLQRVHAASEQHRGAVFRAGFDLILIAFANAASAVRAALVVGALATPEALPVRVAVHAGRCIAVTRAARMELFGETVERVVALLADAYPGTLAVSSAVDDDPAALRATHADNVERKVSTSRPGDYGGRRIAHLTIRHAIP